MRLPPHPAASRPPSPARGEGGPRFPGAESKAPDVEVSPGVEGTIPSPLAGVGGAARSDAPGEGKAKRARRRYRPREVSEPVAFARTLRRNATEAEKKLWNVLRAPPFRAAKFRRQVPIGPYVADFLSYSARVVIEADGSQHDGLRDRRRDLWFERRDWKVLRFTNANIIANMMGVTEMILIALRSSPSPGRFAATLSRKGRGDARPRRDHQQRRELSP